MKYVLMDAPSRILSLSLAGVHTCACLSNANTRAPVRDDLDEKPLERKANIPEADTAVLCNNIPSTQRTGCCV